ncbi:FkbM family methyltransferase [Paraburkholderia sediminicola]|uniref:FkbM family methyltransferase n=1 Tax=Paraburkholderia sediminicola TaxID=458836 RepID=UPI0038BC1B5B
MGITSYAQNFEDILLWRSLGHIVPAGCYIDVGAHHPVQDSVSQLFYEHGWRGIHVEPTADCANLLRIARPDETIIQALVAERTGHSAFHEIPGTGLSTARRDIADEHNKKHGYPVRTELVPAVTLDTLLDLAPQENIHWLKIDVEGFELEVLSGWQKSRRRPWVIVVEATYPNTQIDMSDAWQTLVLEKGYKLVYKDGLNRFYLSQEHPELEDHFAFPPNIFDDFQLSDNPHWLTRSVKQTHNEQLTRNTEEKAAVEGQLREASAAIEQLRAKAQVLERDFDIQTAERSATAQQQAEAHRHAVLELEGHHHIRLVEAREQTREAEQRLVAMQLDVERRLGMAQSRERVLSSLVESKTSELRRKETELLQAALEREHRHAEASRAVLAHQSTLEQELADATNLVSSLQSDIRHEQHLRHEQTTLLEVQIGTATNLIDSLQSDLKYQQDQLTVLARRSLREARLAAHSHTTQLRELESAQTERLLVMRREFDMRETRLSERQLAGIERLHDEQRAREDALREQHLSREGELQQKLHGEITSLKERFDQEKSNFEQRITTLQSHNATIQAAGQNLNAELEHYRQCTRNLAAEVSILKHSWYGRFIWRLRPLARVLSAAQSIPPLDATHPVPSYSPIVSLAIANAPQVAPGEIDASREALAHVPEQTASSGSPPKRTKMKLGELLSLSDEAFIRATFRTVLGREADQTGIDYYLNRLSAGYSKTHVLKDIVRSDEAKARAGYAELITLPDEIFVDAVYQRILGRPADPEGKRHYVELLSRSGNRVRVVEDIQKSAEASKSDTSVLPFEQELAAYLQDAKRDQRWWKRGARLERKLDGLERQIQAISTDSLASVEHQIRALAGHINQLSTGLAVMQQSIQSMGATSETPIEARAIPNVEEIEEGQLNPRRPAVRELDAEIEQKLPSRARAIFLKLRNQGA